MGDPSVRVVLVRWSAPGACVVGQAASSEVFAIAAVVAHRGDHQPRSSDHGGTDDEVRAAGGCVRLLFGCGLGGCAFNEGASCRRRIGGPVARKAQRSRFASIAS